MNLISLPHGKVSICFGDMNITIGGSIYKNLVFIGRLLTFEELSRVNSFQIEEDTSTIVLEEDIFKLTIEDIVGVDENISFDDIEAGIISSIAGAILSKSEEHLYKVEDMLTVYESEVTVIDQMQAVISRYFNTPFEQVRSLPINELYKKFSIFKKTFPLECQAIFEGSPENE